MPGPIPKRESQRRRRNIPKSQGAADSEFVTGAVVAPDLNIDAAHPLVVDLYGSLAGSVEGKYFSAADWQRARLEMHFLNQLLTSGRVPGAQAWTAVQAAMSDLMISPADKRKLGIEIAARKIDEDEDAAVIAIAGYQQRLGG